jgi:hypothetical protein
MQHGFISSVTGPLQWTSREPSVVAKWLQTGEPLVEPSVFSHLPAWRCTNCKMIILTYETVPSLFS